jgi:hypothetical protein
MNRDEIKKYFESFYKLSFGKNQKTKVILEQKEDEELNLFDDEEETETEETEEETKETEEETEETEEETEETKEETEEEVKIEPGDEARLGKQFDIAVDSILSDFEVNALKSAKIYKDDFEAVQTEWKNKKLSDLLFEQEENVSEYDLDIDLFASDVARLIKNYDVLMDMESVIFNKAKEFLMIKYGQDVSDTFSETLKLRHNLDFESEIKVIDDIEDVAPLAVGSGGSGAGA